MKIKEMDFEKLVSLYGIITEICREYSRMTDGYMLATGDSLLERLPQDMKDTISERQAYFSMKDKLLNELKNRLKSEIEW